MPEAPFEIILRFLCLGGWSSRAQSGENDTLVQRKHQSSRFHIVSLIIGPSIVRICKLHEQPFNFHYTALIFMKRAIRLKEWNPVKCKFTYIT